MFPTTTWRTAKRLRTRLAFAYPIALCRWEFLKKCHVPMNEVTHLVQNTHCPIAIKPLSVLRQSLIFDSMTYHSCCTSSRVVIICLLGFGVTLRIFWGLKVEKTGMSEESVQDGSWVSRELRMPKDAPMTRQTWKVGEVLW